MKTLLLLVAIFVTHVATAQSSEKKSLQKIKADTITMDHGSGNSWVGLPDTKNQCNNEDAL